MTADAARRKIESWVNSSEGYITLPIYDVSLKEYSFVHGGDYEITEYSFRELIKLAYNLIEKDEDIDNSNG